MSLSRIVPFLRSIGIPVRCTDLAEPTFLPGVTLSRGALLYDPARLLHPGDLLHEAGHLAFALPSVRATLSGAGAFDLGEEMAAIAWSWAALVHLRLDPAVVFHGGGYRGASHAFIENFSARRFVGVPLLQWAEMTTEKEFPAMRCWLRPQPELLAGFYEDVRPEALAE
ncbi:MAG TPA: hypothetical protein VF618_05920 [Thermoanaerobaculia bacterium]